MQQPGSDLTYGTVPGAPRSDRNTFFWSLPIFGKKMLRKSQSARGPAPEARRNVNPARAIAW